MVKELSFPRCLPRLSRPISIIYRDINPTPENSREAEEMGADVIVATGFDEGGTLPGTALGTFSIVPLIVDAVKRVPVLAAGGITDRRTARAAHALGAQGYLPAPCLSAPPRAACRHR